MTEADFVVIGGGIAGASAAYELAQHGRVVLLEAEATLGYHTTGRSAAMFTEAYESGLVRRLTMASRRFLEDPPEGFSEEPLLRPLPLLFLGREDQEEAIRQLAENVALLGPEVYLLDRDGVLQVCPVLRPEYVGSGVLEPAAREIDVHALHQGFLTGARERGANIRTRARVETLQQAAAGWTVECAGSSFRAPVVVNAAGAWCDVIARMAGARTIGLQPMRRTAFTFPSPIDPLGLPFVDDIDEQWYFKPEGSLFLGSLSEETPMEPHDVRHDETDVALAIERISNAVTFDITRVRSAWAGLRSFARDRKPVVGEDPDRGGFFWLAGQGGFGIMTSPATARVLTSLVVEGRVDVHFGVDEDELSPTRLR